MVTRVPVLGVRPQIEGGRFPVKAVPGEEFTVRARVFGEGRGVVRAAVILSVDIEPADLGLPPGTDLTMRDELDGVQCHVDRVPLSKYSPARILTFTRS